MIWCRKPLGVTPDRRLAAALMSLVHTSVGGEDLHPWPLGDQLCDADLLVDEGAGLPIDLYGAPGARVGGVGVLGASLDTYYELLKHWCAILGLKQEGCVPRPSWCH